MNSFRPRALSCAEEAGWDHRLRDRANGGKIEGRNASLPRRNGDEVYKKAGISYAVEVKKDGIDRETGPGAEGQRAFPG